MRKYIDADALIDFIDVKHSRHPSELCFSEIDVVNLLLHAPTADVAPVVHGRWILTAHEERFNFRWHVEAECSECGEDKGKIWAGFFPDVPQSLAKSVALKYAAQINLGNYCPNCGCRMDGEDGESDGTKS